jgi:hypothetical protein
MDGIGWGDRRRGAGRTADVYASSSALEVLGGTAYPAKTICQAARKAKSRRAMTMKRKIFPLLALLLLGQVPAQGQPPVQSGGQGDGGKTALDDIEG